MFKNTLFPITLLALSQTVFAAPPLPGAGSQMLQIPPVPTKQKTAPKVEIRRGGSASALVTESAKLMVNRLEITGAKAYSENELLVVTGFMPKTELSLADLRGMAEKISDYYHRNGYFVAQAYLPAQEIKDGVVRIAVIDGEYGNIQLRNQSRLSNNLANGILGGLNRGDPVTAAPLENRLLLLSDLPGVNVNSTLLPGAAAGTSDLIVDITPGRRVSGSIDADNAGNRYTGEYRLGATVNLNELIGQGDVATLRAITSGSGLNYGRASYQLQFGKARVGAAYSILEYKLGKEFAPLQANGTAKVASVFGSYPLIRSRNDNLYAGLAFDAKTFRDKIDSTATVTDKKLRVLMGSLYGDHRDNFGGGGFGTYALTLSSGTLDLQTDVVRAFDALTAQSNGDFNKLAINASRLQTLTSALSLYGAINGQIASKNLDVSEKMQLGGMYGVRAYPEGETYADSGYIATAELRLQLPTASQERYGRFQLVGFVDGGSVTINERPWTSGRNHRTLGAVGVGLNWWGGNDFVVRSYYAVKLGNGVATSAPDRSGRFWIQAVKYF